MERCIQEMSVSLWSGSGCKVDKQKADHGCCSEAGDSGKGNDRFNPLTDLDLPTLRAAHHWK